MTRDNLYNILIGAALAPVLYVMVVLVGFDNPNSTATIVDRGITL